MIKKIISISKFVTAVFLLPIVTLCASAQENVKQLRIEEALAAAVEHNRTLQLATLDMAIASANYTTTEAIYLPQIAISYTGMHTNNPLNSFGFILQQKSITQNNFNPDLLNHPKGTPDFTTKLEINQPILNMDLMYKRKGAEKQIAIYQFKKQRTKEYINFEVQKAFLQLALAYQSKKVMEEALATTQAVYQFTENHLQQGLIQKSDLLNVQVQLAAIETNVTKAISNIRNGSDYLSLLMGEPEGTIYSIPSSNELSMKANGSFAMVPSNRSDFESMKKSIEAIDLQITSTKMSNLPKLNAFGSYQLNDSRLLGFGAGAYLAGISVSWDIFKGNTTKNALITQALERNKLTTQLAQQKEQSQTELTKTKRELTDAKFEIAQFTKAIEQAAEALRILQNRYDQGLVNTTDVMLATTQLSQQKLLRAQAIFNQQVSLAYLQFLTISISN